MRKSLNYIQDMNSLVKRLDHEAKELAGQLTALNTSGESLHGFDRYNEIAEVLAEAYLWVIDPSRNLNAFPRMWNKFCFRKVYGSPLELSNFEANMAIVWKQLSHYNSKKYDDSFNRLPEKKAQLQQLNGCCLFFKRSRVKAILSACERTVDKCRRRAYGLNGGVWDKLFKSTPYINKDKDHLEKHKKIMSKDSPLICEQFWKELEGNKPGYSITPPLRTSSF